MLVLVVLVLVLVLVLVVLVLVLVMVVMVMEGTGLPRGDVYSALSGATDWKPFCVRTYPTIACDECCHWSHIIVGMLTF